MVKKAYALVIENLDDGIETGTRVLAVSCDRNIIDKIMKDSFDKSLNELNSAEFTIDDKFYGIDIAELNWHSEDYTFTSTWFITETKIYEGEGD